VRSVLVFSRATSFATLEGEDVTEERITRTAVASTTSRGDARVVRQPAGSSPRRTRRRPRSSSGFIVALAVGATMSDSTFLVDHHHQQACSSWAAALILASIGQLTALLIGGIDLSIGGRHDAHRGAAVVLPVQGREAGQFVLGSSLMLAAATRASAW